MDRLFKALLSFKEVKIRTDDDFADRLSRRYTTILLVFFTCVISTQQLVGKPISCWCPAHFTASHRDYANTICWVSNNYYQPITKNIPRPAEQARIKRVSYYQWVPLVLLFQAAVYFIPCLLWRFLNKRAGIDVGAMMDAAKVCQRSSHTDMREKTLRYIVNQMDRYLLKQRDLRTGCCVRMKHALANYCCFVGGRFYGNYLTFSYLVVKFVYLFNAIGQLFLLDFFLGINYHWYGIFVLNKLIQGEDWTVSERFPRVTLCDFKIRSNNRLHEYIIQCVLTVNLFNEKIFIFIWFWFVFVSIATSFNFARWVMRALYWSSQIRYVKKQLRSFETTKRQTAALTKFTQFYLRRDGMFIIRLISQNVDDLVAAEAMLGLWENYTPERRMLAEKAGRAPKIPTAPSERTATATRHDTTRRKEVV
ncbi:DgyrCDS2610 [Dimorphilus gyrociliatus]|uniref:Innexin n=1 Tax=Dimorphilus gyrociliatus TaxID=2664684 RepID=A0A7I8VAT4_9ANNE|nr:DgyrCDS2610 [Dimorphilus gyrociliatus]